MKATLRKMTPPILWDLAGQVRRLLHPESVQRTDPMIAALQAEFEKANEGLGENVMRFRPNLDLGVHPESRTAFEHFCFRSLEMVAEMNCFLAETKNFQRLLDIGALHGVFSLVFTKDRPGRQALAVDASPMAFARLLYNAHKNPTCDVVPVECALSDREGLLKMHYEWEHAVAAGSCDSEKTIEVQMTTGDELCRQKDFEPDVIKVDVEGHEVKVFRGLTQTLRRCRPTIFLEVHPSRIAQEGEPIAYLAEVLDALGYRARTVASETFTLSSLTGLTQDVRLILTS